jgi:predicted nucleic acid-binding protein
MAGEHGTPVSTDYVLDEGLTVIQARTGRVEDARLFASYFVSVPQVDHDPLLELIHVPERIVDAARKLFFERFERGLSFTDCVVASLARDLDGSVAATEDHFEGIVPTIG